MARRMPAARPDNPEPITITSYFINFPEFKENVRSSSKSNKYCDN
jgi:hypothetical protein